MKGYRKTHPLNTIRRKSVIERLEAQLRSGVKTVKGQNLGGTVALTDMDKTRINKEIGILKARI